MRDAVIGGLAAVWLTMAAGVGLAQPAATTQPGEEPGATQPAEEPATQPAREPTVFDIPRLQAAFAVANRRLLTLFKQEKYAEVEALCRQMIEAAPSASNPHYNLACALARQGKTDAALDALRRSVKLGFSEIDHIRHDPDLASLRDQPAFEAILDEATRAAQAAPDPEVARGIKPAEPTDGAAVVSEGNTGWNPQQGLFLVAFDFQAPPKKPEKIVTGQSPVTELLNRWHDEGTAAGNHGDLYDNRDGGHSRLNLKRFPTMTPTKYVDAAKEAGLHYGLQTRLLFNRPTIGNSSTAMTRGPFWRSQARIALSNARRAGALYLQYVTNHLYFYPEHRDHDPKHGDTFAANTPYIIVSQGSSGSDRAFMEAVASTLAAFRPETKQRLIETRLLMPTVQMIFRSSNKMVVEPDDYLTGAAHPSVFDGKQIDREKMVRLAHEITPADIPPLVQLEVRREDLGVPGEDFFTPGATEKLFDTPAAVARVWRDRAYRKRMVVGAEKSRDANGRPLTYHWEVLRGDPERVAITPVNDDGSLVEIAAEYPEYAAVAEGSKLRSSRIDIGVFVHNGEYYSAPGFICLYAIPSERREYDDAGRIQVIDSTDPEWSKHYADPMLYASRDWRDEYHYDEAGEMTGWTRVRGEDRQEFTAEGWRVLETDDQGRPVRAREVVYVVSAERNQAPRLQQRDGDEIRRYHYDAEEPRITVEPAE